jgi:hypothetical protein
MKTHNPKNKTNIVPTLNMKKLKFINRNEITKN